MASVQRDLFVEVDEQLLLKDNDALKIIADALPETPVLRPYQITEVLPISEDTIYRWLRDFKFTYVDLCAGKDSARYGIMRRSFLQFLATRINKIH